MDDTDLAAQYAYGLGQRVIKTINGQSTYYHYDLNGHLIAETPAGGLVTAGTEHIYKGNGLLSQVDVKTGAIYGYHTNYLGAVHQLTDANGTIVWEAVYQPFGETVINAGSTVVNNFRMPGQYFDAETGLHYNYFRYYDAATGRYLTPDPIGLEGGINLYAYVENDPVNLIDPYGLDWVYSQSTGQMSHQPPASAGGGPPEPVAIGYSGHGQGINNSAMENIPNTGPIPQGIYTIGQQQNNTTSSGTSLPNSMRLTPNPNNQMYGRSGFLIHGDNAAGNQSASHGCIIMAPNVRDRIANSGDNVLRVEQ